MQTAHENRNDGVDKDLLTSLSSWERHLCQSLTRFEVRGKRGRRVPILLTKKMQDSIDVLFQRREEAGVSRRNGFLFASLLSGSFRPMRGASALRLVVKNCDVKQPESITSTRLGKHTATMSQVICLKDNEPDIIANFMGHDIRIHREYYRPPAQTLQMAKSARC